MLWSLTTPAVAQPFQLEPVVSGFDQPVFVTHAGDGSGRLFVVENAGRILIVEDGVVRPRPFLDIEDRVGSVGERGLLGLAFHPRFVDNGRFFIHYTRRDNGPSRISRLRVSPNPNRARRRERVLLEVEQPFSNHNGGMIAFGPDGLLYIALGDGGGAGDPDNRAQDPDDLLGKILRLDVSRQGQPVAIPPDNPFVDGGGRPEIYAVGLRNPWRFAFDRRSGRLFAGDVGQNRWEEISIIRRGRNYGWPIQEGRSCFRPRTGCDRTGLQQPATDYRHVNGRCSVTGGYVYRGDALPALRGTYLFGDLCSGEIFGLIGQQRSVLLDTDLTIVSFGEDADGELFVIDFAGTIFRIVPTAS